MAAAVEHHSSWCVERRKRFTILGARVSLSPPPPFCNNNRKRGEKKSPVPPHDAALLKKVTISHLKKQQREPESERRNLNFNVLWEGWGAEALGGELPISPQNPRSPLPTPALSARGPKYSSQQAPCSVYPGIHPDLLPRLRSQPGFGVDALHGTVHKEGISSTVKLLCY